MSVAQDDSWSCPVCLEPSSNLSAGNQIEILCPVGHATCSECIVRYVREGARNAARPGVLPLRCLIPDCRSELLTEECIRILQDFPEDCERLQRYALINNFFLGSAIICAHRTCGEIFDLVETNRGHQLAGAQPEAVTCPVCKQDTCAKCRRVAHPHGASCNQGLSREEKQNDQLFLEYARSKKVAICPNRSCNACIERISGCNRMKVCFCHFSCVFSFLR